MNKHLPYLTLASRIDHEMDAIKGSRFISIASPVADEMATRALLKEVTSQHPSANHHCWAYQLREYTSSSFSDDGEPSGSAGKPILAPIVGRDLMDVMVIVVRYFGGIQLGVGGLVRAYSQATNAVLKVADESGIIITVVPKVEMAIRYNYDLTSNVASALATLGLNEDTRVYSDCIDSTLQITKERIEHVTQTLTDYTSGKIQITLKER